MLKEFLIHSVSQSACLIIILIDPNQLRIKPTPNVNETFQQKTPPTQTTEATKSAEIDNKLVSILSNFFIPSLTPQENKLERMLLTGLFDLVAIFLSETGAYPRSTRSN